MSVRSGKVTRQLGDADLLFAVSRGTHSNGVGSCQTDGSEEHTSPTSSPPLPPPAAARRQMVPDADFTAIPPLSHRHRRLTVIRPHWVSRIRTPQIRESAAGQALLANLAVL